MGHIRDEMTSIIGEFHMLLSFTALYIVRACAVLFNRITIMAIALYLYQLNQEPYTVALCLFWANFPSLLGLGFCRRWLTKTRRIIRFALLIEGCVMVLAALMYCSWPYVTHPTLVLTLYIVVSVYLSNLSKIIHQLFTVLLLENDWQLARANVLNEILYNLSWITAVPLGAWSVHSWSLSGLFVINSVIAMVLLIFILSLFWGALKSSRTHNEVQNLVDPKYEVESLQKSIIKAYRGIFFWNYLRNITASFVSASMIPLILNTYGINDLIWISLIGNMGIIFAVYRPWSFNASHPARLLNVGQLLLSIAMLCMLVPSFVSISMAFLVFLYGIIATNSLETLILQKRARDEERGALFAAREQMAIFGRTSGYVLSAGLPWLFLGVIAEPNTISVALIASISLCVASIALIRALSSR